MQKNVLSAIELRSRYSSFVFIRWFGTVSHLDKLVTRN